MPQNTGADTLLYYAWDEWNDDGSFPTFGSLSDSDYKPFGTNTTLDTFEGSNNAVRVLNPASREATNVIEQNFSGSVSISFELTNPWWIRAVINEASSSGSDPTTHTFDGDVPDIMRIFEVIEDAGVSAGNHVLTQSKGVVISTATVSVDVDGNVSVTLDGAYADEETDDDISTGSLPNGLTQPSTNERTMTFAQALVQRPDGTDLSLVQSASLTIENNTDMIGELGTRKSVDYSPKLRTADIDYGKLVEDDTEVQRMYGSAATVQEKVTNKESITLQFDNNETGSNKNSLEFQLTGGFPDSLTRSGIGDPESNLENELSEMATTVKAVAENSTSSAR